MTSKIFLDLDVIRSTDFEPQKDIIEIINHLSDAYEVYCFSTLPESSRLEISDFLIDNGVQVEDVLLRAEGDWTKFHALRVNYVLDFFSGNVDTAVEKTACIWINNERAAEELRELGFRIISSDWG